MLVEINFDGIVGPTHNYAGLSLGNLASSRNAGAIAYPRAAALQGLAKMRANLRLGLTQGVLLPHPRPDLHWLASLGATPETADPILLSNAMSASAMWAANAATVSPAPDTADGRCHLTAANLVTMPHRSHEWPETLRQLRLAFADERHFAVHGPVPPPFGDEGAANHMRLCRAHDEPGVEMFVYGTQPLPSPRLAGGGTGPQRQGEGESNSALASPSPGPTASAVPPPAMRGEGDSNGRFPARQHEQASRAVARLHGLDPDRTLFVRQSDEAIAAGAFHNDVVAVANKRVLFTHEHAFADKEAFYAALREKLPEVEIVEVPASAISLTDAIASYLFNAQLVTLPAGGMALILPTDAQGIGRVWEWLESLMAGNGPIRRLIPVDVRQSMANGGGPACLRLRVVCDPATVDPRFLVDEAKLERITAVVERWWPEEIKAGAVNLSSLSEQAPVAREELFRALDLTAIVASSEPTRPGDGLIQLGLLGGV